MSAEVLEDIRGADWSLLFITTELQSHQ